MTATDQSATIWDTATGAGLYTTTNVANDRADALLLDKLPDHWSLFLADLGFGDFCLLDVLTGQETTTFAMIQAQCAELALRQRGARGRVVSPLLTAHRLAPARMHRVR